MTRIQVVSPELPNIPWEERPQSYGEVVWRSKRNPIITRDAVRGANSIFNSAVVPFNGAFAGVFRCDSATRDMQIHSGTSPDGVRWTIEPERIAFKCDDAEIGRFVYAYDPRVCWLEDRYYVTWCNGYHGPTIGVGYTYDFKTFYQMENAFLPHNRNGVLFPRRVGGKYAMLSRRGK
ncbi:MAG TPA: glycosidase, partial [Pseudothauera hydrothermalis]|nr:glycosidase [Pseudothauera hydrothermalis]